MRNEDNFDVVIVGAGITGAIAAKELTDQGFSVLILEAGAGKSFKFEDYQTYLDNFYKTTVRTPNAPFPATAGAPQPLITDQLGIENGIPQFADGSYFHQVGPSTFQSTYTRQMGGTTLHWLGTCLRMLPNDFSEKTLYNNGKDWPISYYDLMPYYAAAELEIGVSADVDEQSFHGIEFEPGYVYPMKKIPQSYSDLKLQEWTKDAQFKYDDTSYDYAVVSIPQGRNSTPNPAYNNGKGYVPVGAVGNPDIGQRCEGNASCVPICPVQAKYNALKTLQKAVANGAVIRSQSVASKVLYDENTGDVTGIMYKEYETSESGELIYIEKVVSAKRYLLAAHAVENAKLLLASGCKNKNIGQNLMDHPVGLSWGLAPEAIGPYRGPGATSGIPALRDGAFRKNRSAFRVEIGNWGWSWPKFTPNSTVQDAVIQKKFGADLRKTVIQKEERLMRIGMLVEMQALSNNAVTIDDRYRDELGNYRPVITFMLSDHEKRGLKAARSFCVQMFEAAGIEDKTDYKEKRNVQGYLVFEDEELWWQGAGHYAGTHIMGTNSENSVVDASQRSHEHNNLFLTGCGNMPSMGTSNPTLTAAALAVWAAENIAKDLNNIKSLRQMKYKQPLFNNLQTAIELEHSTIPPYLVAYFTINDKTNAFAANTIRSVFMEEMLHMSLACQILNAVNGEPFIDHAKFVPEYPAQFNFKDREFDVGLIKFSKEAVETFMQIEKPDDVPLNVKGEDIPNLVDKIDLGQSTIGEFYAVIKKQLIELTKEYGEEAVFNGDKNRQLDPAEYYGGGGGLIVVDSLATALFAIDVIVEQGEGSNHSIWDGDATYFGQDKEVAHFFRFKEIYEGQLYQEGDCPKEKPTGPEVAVNWDAVQNMIDDPKANQFPDSSTAREASEEFNQFYSQFLEQLHLSFNGEPHEMRRAVGMMYQMKYLAQSLLNTPVPGKEGKVAGPSFEYVPIKARKRYNWSVSKTAYSKT